MIATLDEIKTILSITDTTYDTFINIMIPVVQEEIVNYCSSRFTNQTFGVYSNALVFVSDGIDYDYITGDFENISFQVGAEIFIKNTKLNDGYYTIQSKTDEKIEVTSIGTMISETVSSYVNINQTKYNSSLKLAMSYMIQDRIDSKPNSIKSEKMGEYSVSFADNTNVNSYPDSIIAILKPFRRLVW